MQWDAKTATLTLDDDQAAIVCDPEIRAGIPTIRGTRIPVWIIVAQQEHYPNIEDLLRNYPRAGYAGIQAALRYYEDHRTEIDAQIAEADAAVE